MLNDILTGQKPPGEPDREQPPVTAPCARCGQPFPSRQGVGVCADCVRIADEAAMRAMAAEARRSRRNNLLYGSILLVGGLLLTWWSFSTDSSVRVLSVGPVLVGGAAVFRGLIA
ncbi:MAG TPA: hypothetical protein VLX92_31515 [Kofleriaceae bacterium]|nr:hypothetical protein [Kofleriaceae bacterium]